MDNRKIACWDMDDTLGAFMNLTYRLHGQTPSKYDTDANKPSGLRHGIRDLLVRLSSQDFTHVVTTGKVKSFAEPVLKHIGLDVHFDRVYGREEIVQGVDKYYESVARDYGLSDEEARSKMIVIGDAPGDEPKDLGGVVFVEHCACLHFDSIVTEKILQRLGELGNSDFYRGFQSWHQSLKPEEEGILKTQWQQFHGDARFGMIEDNIKLILNYEREGKVPTIRVEDAHNYKRELELVD